MPVGSLQTSVEKCSESPHSKLTLLQSVRLQIGFLEGVQKAGCTVIVSGSSNPNSSALLLTSCSPTMCHEAPAGQAAANLPLQANLSLQVVGERGWLLLPQR